MIPILFENTETAFTSNGIGRLADAIKCEITEERNGQYELYLEYPVTGVLASELVPGRYIFATHDDSGVPQAFQIYSVEHHLQDVSTVRAWHISYALNGIILRPFTAVTCAGALAAIPNASMNVNPFTFWTDKQVTGDFVLKEPASVRSVLGGKQGSILDTYGTGEYEFDMYDVKLHLHRGEDRGVQIRYAKNLTKLDQELDASNVYVSAVPFWKSSDGNTVVYYNGVVTRTGSTPGRAVPMDLSGDFEDEPTTAQLQAACQAKLDASTSYTLKENLKIDFVALWQTEEYKNIAVTERIYLCDTVHVLYVQRGIDVSAKCIKVVYDTLHERYVSMELGEPRATLGETIQRDIMSNVPTKDAMEQAISDATKTIVSEGTYPSGTHGVLTMQAGTLESEGLSSTDHYKSVFEASDFYQEWYDLNDPNTVWKTWLEAGALFLSKTVNGTVVAETMFAPEPTVIDTPGTFVTAASGYAIQSGSLAIHGKLAQMTLNITCTSPITIPALGDITNFTPATLNAGYRPVLNSAFATYGDYDGVNGVMRTDGQIRVTGFSSVSTSARTLAAGTPFKISALFMLA